MITFFAIVFTLLFFIAMFTLNLVNVYRRLKNKPSSPVHASINEHLLNDQYQQRQEIISRIRIRLHRDLTPAAVSSFLESGLEVVDREKND